MTVRDKAEAIDRYLDFCHWEYAPRASWEGKFRSAELLRQSFRDAGRGDQGDRLCSALTSGIGSFQTVWGVKWDGSAVSWELYFYDYARRQRQVSVDVVRHVLEGVLILPTYAPVVGDPPYFMCSVEFDAGALSGDRPAKEVNIYLDNAAFDGNSGHSYRLTDGGPVLGNSYYFNDRAGGLRRVHDLVATSLHLGTASRELQDWNSRYRGVEGSMIVVANKTLSDGLYYTRLDHRALARFIGDFGFPGTLLDLLEGEGTPFDHLLFDVGFDVRSAASGSEVRKSAVFGVL